MTEHEDSLTLLNNLLIGIYDNSNTSYDPKIYADVQERKKLYFYTLRMHISAADNDRCLATLKSIQADFHDGFEIICKHFYNFIKASNEESKSAAKEFMEGEYQKMSTPDYRKQPNSLFAVVLVSCSLMIIRQYDAILCVLGEETDLEL